MTIRLGCDLPYFADPADIRTFAQAAEDIEQPVEIVYASSDDDLAIAFERLKTVGAEGLLVCASPFFDTRGKHIVAFEVQGRLPAIHQFRERVGPPARNWDAKHLAKAYFAGLEGDIRLSDAQTILVTYYNAPDATLLKESYEHLPKKLKEAGIDPRIPWLYNYQIDFRFR